MKKLLSYFVVLTLGVFCGMGGTCLYSCKKEAKKLQGLSSDEKEVYLGFTHKLRDLEKCKKNLSFSSLMWEIYPHFIQMGMYPFDKAIDQEYQEKGYKEGLLSRTHVDRFREALAEAETKEIALEDYDPSYVSNIFLRQYEKALNSSHKLYVLKEKQLEALQPILEELKEPVAACLGSPWSIINVLCWETFPDAVETGPNEWHKDGIPLAINKVMIYLTGASMEKGTTLMKLDDKSYHHAEGPEGTWLLFKVNEILHKGVKPQTGSRIALEIRAIPSFHYDLRPYVAGFNGLYPKYPWYQPITRDICLKDTVQ